MLEGKAFLLNVAYDLFRFCNSNCKNFTIRWLIIDLQRDIIVIDTALSAIKNAPLYAYIYKSQFTRRDVYYIVPTWLIFSYLLESV